MNYLLLRASLQRHGSLQSFADYRHAEARAAEGAERDASTGSLPEWETLELRINPPNVEIDNETHDDVTAVNIDSANRPGTLVEVRRHV